jgi:hypothetical protein
VSCFGRNEMVLRYAQNDKDSKWNQFEYCAEDLLFVPNLELEEFAKTLVEQVRDATIKSCDRVLQPNATYPVAKRWKEAGLGGNLESIASVVIPDTVDETIFHLLRAIDQGLLKLSFNASNGKEVDLPADGLGELGGWYAGIPGWRSMYSKERFIDDYSDLVIF